MKRALLMMVMMGTVGGALAAKTTVNQPVSADVSNVCTYGEAWDSVAGNPPVSPSDGKPGNETDVDGKTYTDGSTFDVTAGGSYRANSTVQRMLDQTYIFRCTKGTPWNAVTGDVTLTLTNGKDSLKVVASRYDDVVYDNGSTNGDIHLGSVKFSIPTGQYSAAAGHYTGTLSIAISYN